MANLLPVFNASNTETVSSFEYGNPNKYQYISSNLQTLTAVLSTAPGTSSASIAPKLKSATGSATMRLMTPPVNVSKGDKVTFTMKIQKEGGGTGDGWGEVDLVQFRLYYGAVGVDVDWETDYDTGYYDVNPVDGYVNDVNMTLTVPSGIRSIAVIIKNGEPGFYEDVYGDETYKYHHYDYALAVESAPPPVDKDYYLKLNPAKNVTPTVNASHFDNVSLQINGYDADWDSDLTLSTKSPTADPVLPVEFALKNVPDIPNVAYDIDGHVLNASNDFKYTRDYDYIEDAYTRYVDVNITVNTTDYKADVKVAKGTVTQVLPDGSTGVVSDDTVFSELVFDVNGESSSIDEIVTLIESGDIINPTKDVVIRLTNPDLNNTYKLNGITLNNDNSYSITASNVQFNITASNTNTYSLDVHKPAEMLAYSVNFKTTVTGYTEDENGALVPDSTVPTNVRTSYNGVEGFDVTLTKESLTENPTGDVTLAVLDTVDNLVYTVNNGSELTGFVTYDFDNVTYKKQPDVINVEIKVIRKYVPPTPNIYKGVIKTYKKQKDINGVVQDVGTELNNTFKVNGMAVDANDEFTITVSNDVSVVDVTLEMSGGDFEVEYSVNGVPLDADNNYTATFTRRATDDPIVDTITVTAIYPYTPPEIKVGRLYVDVETHKGDENLGLNSLYTAGLRMVAEDVTIMQGDYFDIRRKSDTPLTVNIPVKLLNTKSAVKYYVGDVELNTSNNYTVNVPVAVDTLTDTRIKIRVKLPTEPTEPGGTHLQLHEYARATTMPEGIFINGVDIEKKYPGVLTLQVTGRELMGHNVTTFERAGLDGEGYQYATRPSRTINVVLHIKAVDNADFRRKMRELNGAFNDKEFRVSFRDDLEHYYIGTVSDVGDFPPGVNEGTVDLTIYCSDPYSYSVEPLTTTFTGVNNIWRLVEYGYISILSVKIENTSGTTLENVGVTRTYTSNGKKIGEVMVESLAPGEIVKWNFEDNTLRSNVAGVALRESPKTSRYDFAKNIAPKCDLIASNGIRVTSEVRLASL